jgi:hypothetical protein
MTRQNMYRVKERPDLLKDMSSGAILLTDTSAADDYMAKKKMLNNNRVMGEELNTIKAKLAEIDNLKNDIGDIKELLQRIVNK